MREGKAVGRWRRGVLCAPLWITLALAATACAPDVGPDGSCSLGYDDEHLPRCNITQAYLLNRPGVKLAYPGSHLVGRSGADQVGSTGGALVDSTYTVQAEPAQVIAWFRQHLEALGLLATRRIRPLRTSCGCLVGASG